MEAGTQPILAQRLGKTVHVSPLRFKLERLRREFPCAPCMCVEDWLVVIANRRDAFVVSPPFDIDAGFEAPSRESLSDEELIVGICYLGCLDRPQILRLAAQLISRAAIDVEQLCLIARRERVDPILAELSRQALKVAPEHAAWLDIQRAFDKEPPPREPVLHWSRLAQPIMNDGRYNARTWKLVD